MATPQEVLSDPKFHALPVEEKRKVMLAVDPSGFGALAPQEQDRVFSVAAPAHRYTPEEVQEHFKNFAPLQYKTGLDPNAPSSTVSEQAGQGFMDMVPTPSKVGKLLTSGHIVENMAAPNIEQGRRAAEEFKKGNYLQAIGHGTAAALPFIGPAAADFGEMLPENPARAMGQAGAALIGSEVVPRVTRGIANAMAPELPPPPGPPPHPMDVPPEPVVKQRGPITPIVKSVAKLIYKPGLPSATEFGKSILDFANAEPEPTIPPDLFQPSARTKALTRSPGSSPTSYGPAKTNPTRRGVNQALTDPQFNLPVDTTRALLERAKVPLTPAEDALAKDILAGVERPEPMQPPKLAPPGKVPFTELPADASHQKINQSIHNALEQMGVEREPRKTIIQDMIDKKYGSGKTLAFTEKGLKGRVPLTSSEKFDLLREIHKMEPPK